MGYLLYVFCCNEISISSKEMIEFILNGAFFEEDPQFVTESEPDTSALHDWKTLSVNYSPNRKQIVIANHKDDDLFKKILSELLFILDHSRISTSQQKVQGVIKASSQIFTIQIEHEDMTEDAWEMVDSIESWIANKCDGLVYAPNEGFYNARLKKIYRL